MSKAPVHCILKRHTVSAPFKPEFTQHLYIIMMWGIVKRSQTYFLKLNIEELFISCPVR